MPSPRPESDSGYVTRFAPSPTGLLHLGHAYSALVAAERARAHGGRLLLRIEDIDTPRCRPEYEAAIIEDLAWLGLDWEAPVMRQSARRAAHDAALRRLGEMGLLYPCRCTRGDIRAALSAPQEGAPVDGVHGPDGLVYPGACRGRALEEAGAGEALRLDMARALERVGVARIAFTETGGVVEERPEMTAEEMIRNIGDVVLARRDIGNSYHLSVVVDDAAQGVTEVVRGADLFAATFIHRLLQELLGLPVPAYHHHRLIRDETGRRLAKRDDARAIRRYREEGFTPEDIRRMVGLEAR